MESLETNYESDVMVIEKMPFPGGASIMASGPISGAQSRFHDELGMEAPWAEFRDYIVDGAVFPHDPELVDLLYIRGAQNNFERSYDL